MTQFSTTTPTHGATFRGQTARLVPRFARRHVGNIANDFHHNNLTIGENKVGALPARPDERKP
eukprot:13351042-Alexandrium_andersonii.AAC.1